MTTSTPVPLEQCLAFLRSIDGTAPDDALERLRALRGELVGFTVELLWEDEPVQGRVDYDLVVRAPGAGTVSLAWAPETTGVPFALRGMQRLKEAELVRVDGRSLWMHEAVALLDPFWGEAPIRQRLLDLCVLRRELEARPYRASPEELQQAVDAFRRARGLDRAEEAAAWLEREGLSLAQLEDQLEAGDLARAALRREKVAAQAEAEFARGPERYDEVEVSAFAAADAEALADEIRAGADLLAVARRGGGRRSVLVDTVRRKDLASDRAVEPGAVIAGRIAGAGPYVVAIGAITPARWDQETRDAVEELLFRRWLDDAVRGAHVEWNWGPAS